MIVGCVIIFFYSVSGIIKVVEILKKIINDTGINDEQIIIPVSYTHLDVYKRQEIR